MLRMELDEVERILEDAELVSVEEAERIRAVDPEVKRVLKESVGSEG